MTRLDLRIDAQTGWRRFLLRCCYRAWQLAMMLCAISLLCAMVVPIATVWVAGQSEQPVEMLKMGILLGSAFGLPGLVGLLMLELLEGTVWPTWWSM